MFDRIRPKRDQLDPEKHLETCAMCAADFVNPVDWEPVGDTHWWMLLRCGACDTWREVTVTNEIAARFDLELDRRLDVVARALEHAASLHAGDQPLEVQDRVPGLVDRFARREGMVQFNHVRLSLA